MRTKIPNLYIELSDKKLYFATLRKEKDTFIVGNKNVQKLLDLEIIEATLYNPSKIYLHIKNLLEKNKIKKPKAVVCIKQLSKGKKEKTQNQLLQTALCICKADIKINKLIDTPINFKENCMQKIDFFYKKELDNRLDFFKKINPPPKGSLLGWILITLFFSSALIYFYSLIFIKEQNILEALKKKNENLSKNNPKLKKENEAADKLAKDKDKLRKKYIKAIKISKQWGNPLNTLLAISKTIPNECAINSIKINTNKKHKKNNKNDILLKGYSKDPKKIALFVEKISKSAVFKKNKLIKLQRENIRSGTKYYNFDLSMKLTGSQNGP